MAGASLYGSFRAGVSFGSGDTSAADYGSRWGFKGTNEVSEGLTASYKYETHFNTSNAESAGGAGHSHAAVAAVPAVPAGADTDEVLAVINVEDGSAATSSNYDMDDDTAVTFRFACADPGNPIHMMTDDDGNVRIEILQIWTS